MTRNITSTPRIPILQPSPPNIIILIINLQLHTLQKVLALMRNLQRARPRAHYDHADMAFCEQGLFGDAVAGEVLVVPGVLVRCVGGRDGGGVSAEGGCDVF